MVYMMKTRTYSRHPESPFRGFGGPRTPLAHPQETVTLRGEAQIATTLGLMLLAARRGGQAPDLSRLAERTDLHYLTDAAARWADEQPPASHDPVFGLTSPEEQWALANLMRSIQDEGDPITRQAPPVELDTCTHGIPFAQDCAACDEFAR